MTIYFDLETTALSPYESYSDVRIVSIDGKPVYDLWNSQERQEALRELRSRTDELMVGHNLGFDLIWLREHFGYTHQGPLFDTMIAYQILTNGRYGLTAGLDAVYQHLFSKKLDKSQQKSGWDAMILMPEQLEYARMDTEVIKPIHEKLALNLDKQGLQHIMDLEMKLLPVLVSMKERGVHVDTSKVHALIGSLGKEQLALMQELPMGLNPRSNEQVKAWFNLPDAQEDTLRPLVEEGNEEAIEVAKYKKITKKKSSVWKQILGNVKKDGRIHGDLTQTMTDTGRLSSKNPNMQNQGSTSDVRSLFTAEPGNKLVVADYSGLELRLAALISGESVMLDAFRNERDLHDELRKSVLGEGNTKDENKKLRTLAKNIGFGYVFGSGPGTLVQIAAKMGNKIEEADARRYHDLYHKTYPTISRWHKRVGTSENKYVYSLFGRRRYIEPGKAYSTRINTPVQASAADGMKMAMIAMYENGYTPILSVHDELVLEVPEEEAEVVLETLCDTMVREMYRATKQNPDKPTVPITVEGDIGDTWAEAK